MIYRKCGRCGKRIEAGTTCPCQKERRNTSNRTDGVRKEYRTYKWLLARERCFNTYDHVDIYALYRHNQVLPASVIHHITEALDAPQLFYEPSNHIPVSVASHKEIHDRYKSEDIEAVRAELRSYCKKYREDAEKSL